MKVIKYKILCYMGVWNPETEEVEQKECLAGMETDYTEAAYEKALATAYNGEVTVEEVEDEPTEPTQLDRVEAQVTYTAMMTDTLLEV